MLPPHYEADDEGHACCVALVLHYALKDVLFLQRRSKSHISMISAIEATCRSNASLSSFLFPLVLQSPSDYIEPFAIFSYSSLYSL